MAAVVLLLVVRRCEVERRLVGTHHLQLSGPQRVFGNLPLLIVTSIHIFIFLFLFIFIITNLILICMLILVLLITI
jgi:hypothetical protein